MPDFRSRARAAPCCGTAAIAATVLGGCKTERGAQRHHAGHSARRRVFNTPTGTDPLRFGVHLRFHVRAFDGNTDSFTTMSGNMADEIYASDTFDDRLSVNARRPVEINDDHGERVPQPAAGAPRRDQGGGQYSPPSRRRRSGSAARCTCCADSPRSSSPKAGARARRSHRRRRRHGHVRPAELDRSSCLQTAVASFDTALTLADTSKRVMYGAQIGRGRALLGLGKYTEAAAAVTGVPRSVPVPHLSLDGQLARRKRHVERGRERLDALLAHQRTKARTAFRISRRQRSAHAVGAIDAHRLQQHARTNLPTETKFAPTTSGIVARRHRSAVDVLEARLQGGTQADRDAVFAGLNTPARRPTHRRSRRWPAARRRRRPAAVDQLFAERAYWTWLTGHRLGDMRRLVRNYGRDVETVFPTGTLPSPLVGTYGSATSIVIPFNEKNNRNFRGCLDTKA